MTVPRAMSCVFLATASGLMGAGSPPVPPADQPGFQPVEPAFRADLEDVPDTIGLPRVLLIGDSISIGYTRAVRARLAGEANVHRPGENCGSTSYGLSRLEAWLSPGSWDVIHFNFGLHDLKFLDAAGTYTTPDKGRQVAPIETYQRNLRELVRRMVGTRARLIFATTTPVPPGAQGRIAGSERAYNEAAIAVMRAFSVAIDDLHAFAAHHTAEHQLPQNVHFNPAGSEALAGEVAASIRRELRPRAAP